METRSNGGFAFGHLTEAQAVQIVTRADTPQHARYWELIDDPRERLLIGGLEPTLLDAISELLDYDVVKQRLGRYEVELLRDWILSSMDQLK